MTHEDLHIQFEWDFEKEKINIDGLVKSKFIALVHASTSSARTDFQ